MLPPPDPRPSANAGDDDTEARHRWRAAMESLVSTKSLGALVGWFKRAWDSFDAINGTVWSASFAYYAFFALVPMLLLLVTITTDIEARIHGESEAQSMARDYILSNIPLGSEGRHLIADTLQGVMRSRGKIGLVAVVGLLWSSLGFFQSLVSAINQAWGQEPLNWWRLPLQNAKILAVLLSALVLGNVIPTILQTVQGYAGLGSAVFSPFVGILGALVPSVVLFYGFLLFYKLAPRSRSGASFSTVWIPALIVTALLQVCQRLLTLYTTNITNFNAVYGAFGGVIAMLLWIYASGVIIVFGGCLCAARRLAAPTTLRDEDGTPHTGIVPPK